MPRPGKTLVGILMVALAARASAQRLPSSVGSEEINLYARLLAMTDTRQLDMSLVERALESGDPREDLLAVRAKLGEPGASRRAAEAIMSVARA